MEINHSTFFYGTMIHLYCLILALHSGATFHPMMHNWDFAMKMLVSSICNFNALFYPLNSVKNNQIWHSHSDSIDQEMKWCKTAKHVYQNSKNQCTVTKSIWPHTHGLFVYISSDDELHQKLFWKILQPIKASFCIFLSCIITQLPCLPAIMRSYMFMGRGILLQKGEFSI